MLRTFIQTTALLLTLIAAFFLFRGHLTLSPITIAELSSSRLGYSQPTIRSLVAQNIDSRMGLILILTAFCLQLVNVIWEKRLGDSRVNFKGIFLSSWVSLVVLIAALQVSNSWCNYLNEAVITILRTR